MRLAHIVDLERFIFLQGLVEAGKIRLKPFRPGLEEGGDFLFVLLGQRSDRRVVVPGQVGGKIGGELALKNHLALEIFAIVDSFVGLVSRAPRPGFDFLRRRVHDRGPAELGAIRLCAIVRGELDPDLVLPFPHHLADGAHRNPERGRDLALLEEYRQLLLPHFLLRKGEVIDKNRGLARDGLDLFCLRRLADERGELKLDVDHVGPRQRQQEQ